MSISVLDQMIYGSLSIFTPSQSVSQKRHLNLFTTQKRQLEQSKRGNLNPLNARCNHIFVANDILNVVTLQFDEKKLSCVIDSCLVLQIFPQGTYSQEKG